MLRIAVVLALGGLVACQSESKVPLALLQLESLFLAPPPEEGRPWLLAGEYEVTRAEWAGKETAAGNLPQAWVDRNEASAWALSQGFRLPTLLEWRWLALGRSPTQRVVWGSSPNLDTANVLELGFHRPLPGGVFERQSGPFGGWDFLGNVWEWVVDPSKPHGSVTACGGGYAHYVRGAVAGADPNMRLRHLASGEKADDIGLRLLTEAEPWLLQHGLPLWENPLWRDRVERRFQSWHGFTRQQLAKSLRETGAPSLFCAALSRQEG